MPYPDSTYEQTWREARADKPFVLEDVNQHTPGPWHNHHITEVAEPADGEFVSATGITTVDEFEFLTFGRRGDLVAFVPHDRAHHANSRLIAAAPCLLSALERLMGEIGDGFNCDPSDDTLSQCWSAIRKARRGGE